MKYFQYNIQCDCGALHKLLQQNSFNVVGITYDTALNIATVMLDDSETKDPTDVVNSYVYVPYVPPDYPALFASANNSYQEAVTQYIGAKQSYINAVALWNAAGTDVTSTNAIAKLKTAQVEIVSAAIAIDALAVAVNNLYEVVKVLTQKVDIVEE
jgi:hypothetical protein